MQLFTTKFGFIGKINLKSSRKAYVSMSFYQCLSHCKQQNQLGKYKIFLRNFSNKNEIKFNKPIEKTEKPLNFFFQKNLFKNKFNKAFFVNYRIVTTTENNENFDGNKRNKIDSEYLARQFVNTLTPSERLVIKDELIKVELEMNQLNITEQIIPDPTFKQLISVCLQAGLPFVGFGFVDNFLMIVAGDLIESYIGFFFPISTMAAAGLGNAVSDVVGIGLAHHIENFCSKLINVPKLTPEQWSKPIVGRCAVFSKSISILIGCIIGMAPLLFINQKSEEEGNNVDNKNPKEKS